MPGNPTGLVRKRTAEDTQPADTDAYQIVRIRAPAGSRVVVGAHVVATTRVGSRAVVGKALAGIRKLSRNSEAVLKT